MRGSRPFECELIGAPDVGTEKAVTDSIHD